jgi:oligopeptide/dipeptide ABC transporter ATP-binding protein
MYQGKVVEQGDVDKVINHPSHPYTKLLVNCIPKPDPTDKWIETEELQELIKNL